MYNPWVVAIRRFPLGPDLNLWGGPAALRRGGSVVATGAVLRAAQGFVLPKQHSNDIGIRVLQLGAWSRLNAETSARISCSQISHVR